MVSSDDDAFEMRHLRQKRVGTLFGFRVNAEVREVQAFRVSCRVNSQIRIL